MWCGGACGVLPEGSQEHSRRVCGTEKCAAVAPARNVLTIYRLTAGKDIGSMQTFKKGKTEAQDPYVS